jgi:hypothetical protein
MRSHLAPQADPGQPAKTWQVYFCSALHFLHRCCHEPKAGEAQVLSGLAVLPRFTVLREPYAFDILTRRNARLAPLYFHWFVDFSFDEFWS